MGVMGELFPGKKLTNENSEDSGGQTHRPRVDLDLEAGVIRVSPGTRPAEDEHSG
ncbi:hypothetical protein [Nocardia otitidiscaviarum]|uniref:hypothetical protein n=1 Tax=Nocardia otitidiscaviarum TaxID=1823 RepID=UPI00163D6F05|nr:hypothetical protein [Nocardia otitidiscaviarum]MBF6177174.1 hypothetical protein [Nocardia otitidiscaviarum]MCP9618997.1 hypothetical protein [Nocardia otitidiscaviarum]